jgi:hypothetical protein
MPADGLSWAPVARVMNSFIIRLHQWETSKLLGKKETFLTPEPRIYAAWGNFLEIP